MLLANILSGFALTFELFLYILLGLTVGFKQPEANNNNLISYAPPTPSTEATTTTTAAPITLTCSKIAGASICNPCPSDATGGTIQSPGYPNDYGVSATDVTQCVYRIFAPTGKKVKMTLSAGANLNYVSSENAFPSEKLIFLDSGANTELGIPTTYPTTSATTYTTTSNQGIFRFDYDKTACSNAPCKWEVTISGTA